MSARTRFRIGVASAAVTAWRVLAVGAGGQLSGMTFADDGSVAVRTDTYGAWLWNGTTWTQFVTMTSMPAADSGITVTDTFELGVYEICFAPSNSNRMYMLFNGYVYVSGDKGTTWTRCVGWTHVTDSLPNSNAKFLGRFMAVDPINPDVMIVGTSDSGCFITANAGTTFTQIASLGTATTGGGTLQQGGGHLIAFDRSSAQSGGKTQGIYISTYGRGVDVSTNGGSTFSAVSSAPTTHRHMVCSSTGVLWHVDNSGPTTGLLRKYTGSWATQTVDGSQNNRAHSVAVDPADATHVVVGMDPGDLRVTANSGTSWSGDQFNQTTRTATDIPWLAWTKEDFMSNGDMQFDPSGSNRLCFAEGIGFWTTTPPASGQNTAWTSQSRGIEQLVGNRVSAPPNGNLILACWDRPLFYKSKSTLSSYPSTHGPDRLQAILMCWALDYASSDPTTIVALTVTDGVANKSGISTDGGQNWTVFASQSWYSSGQGGGIAASTPTNIIIAPATGARPFYTKDGGASWAQTNPAPTTNWGIANYLFNPQIVSADRVAANTFLMYNHGSSAPGIYKSTDSGDNWTKVFAGHLANFDGGRESIRHVPGNSGHAFYSAGNLGGSNPGDTAFMRTTDQGTNWSAVPNVKEVYNFGFGKAKTGGGGYPTIFIVGYVSSVFGVWRSDDGEQATPTWTSIGDGFPAGSFDFIKWVEGDPDVYGRCFVAFNGSGFAYYGQ